jgi:hypothetical protein
VEGKVTRVIKGKTVAHDKVGSTMFLQKHVESDLTPTMTGRILQEWLLMIKEMTADMDGPSYLTHYVFCEYRKPMKAYENPDQVRAELDFPNQTIIRKSKDTFAEQLYQDRCVTLYERHLFSCTQKHELKEAGKTYVNKPRIRLRRSWSWLLWENSLHTTPSEHSHLSVKVTVMRKEAELAEKLWGRITPIFMNLYDQDGYLIDQGTGPESEDDDIFGVPLQTELG